MTFEPDIGVLILLVLIGIGAPIFLALGATGVTGLYMTRGAEAFNVAPSSFLGQLNSVEPIALRPATQCAIRGAIGLVGAAFCGVMAWYGGHAAL